MNIFKNAVFKRPILYTLLLTAIALAIIYLPTKNLLLTLNDLQLTTFIGQLINNLIVSILLIFCLHKLDLVKSLGLTTIPKKLKDWLIAWPLLIILLLILLPIITGSLVIDLSKPFIVSLFTIMNFFIGLAEELLVRGFILSMLIMKWGTTKNGIYQSVIISSLIFGCAHLGNLIIDPGLIVATLSQVFYATFIGVFFAACVLRSQSIWPAIILHATIDFVGQLQQITIGGGIEAANQVTASVNLLQAMQPIILYGMLASYGFFLLKKVTPVTIESKFTNQAFIYSQQTTKDRNSLN